jgi:hypothetical protein
MRIRSLAVGALCCAAPALADSPVLSMTAPPQAFGWNYLAAGGGNAVVAGNTLHVDSPVGAFAGFEAPASLWPAASANPGGWRVQATCLITSSVINSANDGCLMLNAGDGTYRHMLELYPDHIALTNQAYSGVTSVPFSVEGTLYHSYEMVGLGATVTVSIDGAPVMTATALGASPGFNDFEFGDLLYANESHSLWSHVEFNTVPAPGSAALLIAAGALARRRR